MLTKDQLKLLQLMEKEAKHANVEKLRNIYYNSEDKNIVVSNGLWLAVFDEELDFQSGFVKLVDNAFYFAGDGQYVDYKQVIVEQKTECNEEIIGNWYDVVRLIAAKGLLLRIDNLQKIFDTIFKNDALVMSMVSFSESKAWFEIRDRWSPKIIQLITALYRKK